MKRSLLALITLIFFLLSSQKNLQAQYSAWKTFSTLDGLAGNTVYAIFEAGKDSLWFATDKGVSFYDGINWTTFRIIKDCAGTFNDKPSSNIVTAIAKDGQGAIWAGTRGTKASRGCGAKKYDGGEWKTFTTDSGLVSDEIFAILMDSKGAIWFGTEEGVNRYDGKNWAIIDSPDSLLWESRVLDIIEDRRGALWFAVNNGELNGALRFDGKEWTLFDATNSDLPRYEHVLTIYESHDALWFGTTYGVSRFDGEKWMTFTPRDSGIARGDVNAISEGNSGIMWFGTGNGLSRYDGKNWMTFTEKNSGLLDKRILSIYKDLNGTLWVGAKDGGVARYHEDEWTSFNEFNSSLDETPRIIQIVEDNQGAIWTLDRDVLVDHYNGTEWQRITSQNSGLVSDEVNALSTTRQKEVWFATANGASRYDGQQWTTFNTQNSGLVSDVVNTIFEDNDDVQWFGTEEGLSRYDGKEWKSFTTGNSGLGEDEVIQIVQDSRGSLWFLHNGDISRYDGSVWTVFDSDADIIVADRQGGIWGGSQRDGVSHYDGEKWTNYTTANSGLAGNWVHAILVDKQDALWFATKYYGISRYDGKDWTTFDVENSGLIDNQVQAIVEDDRGAVWIGSYNGESDAGGVNRYDKGQWLSFTPQNSDSALPSFAVNYIFADSKGFLWFATRDGVTRFKGDDTAPNTEIAGGPQGVHGTSTAVFAYRGGDNFTQSNKLLFSTAIVPAARALDERDWSFPTAQIFAETPILSNGAYTFYVRAKDEFGNVDPIPARRTFTVDITPPTVTLTSPNSNDAVTGQVAIVGSAFDASPLKDFASYQLNYGIFTSDNQEPTWQKDRFSQIKSSEVRNDTLEIFDTVGLADSLYRIRLLAIDTLKHSSKDEILVTVDNTAPRVEIIRPVLKDTIEENIHVQAMIFDRKIDRARLEYKMRYHHSWQTLVDLQIIQEPIEYRFNYTWKNSSDSGEVSLRLTAWDKAGNSSVDSVQFLLNNFDFQRPTATISQPQDNAYVHDWLPITGFVRDESALHYRLSLRAPNLNTLLAEGNKPRENEALHVLDTKAFADGKYTLNLTVTNERQYQRSHSIAMTIDNTPPVAQLAASLPDTISCSVQLQGEVFDHNLAGMTLKYAKVAETDPSKFVLLDTAFALWNTMELHGAYTLYLFAKDQAGLETAVQSTYYLNNPRYEKSTGVSKKQGAFSLYIPPNGFPASVFCLKKIARDVFKFDANVLMPTDLIMEIQTSDEQTAFDKPGILTIDYRSLPLTQLEENRLKVHVWENQAWKLLGGTLDKEKKRITTTIGRTGIYGLFENKGALEPSEVSKELRLESQPRIFSPQGNGFSNTTALSFDLGKSANVTIKVYNAAGRLVRVLKENESMPHGNNVVYWDGKDEWSIYCAGGLYMVTIQAAEKVATKTVVVVNK